MNQITYQNGNYNISILNDGTKIREYDNIPNPIYPESIDVKITNYCDAKCTFCHEMSTVEGKHGDLNKLFQLLKSLPAGVEIAIGGGNPLSHPNLVEFLIELKQIGIITNITVNQLHLKPYKELLTFLIKDELIKGFGISYNSKDLTEIKYFSSLTNNIVIHLIAGVHILSTMDDLYSLFNKQNKTLKVLLLGYKKFGFGINYYTKFTGVDFKIFQWYTHLHEYFKLKNLIISFDNLGIAQLNVKRFFTAENWKKFYMGADGQFTMYIDAIEGTYTVSSTNPTRLPFHGKNIAEIFNNVKNKLSES